MNTRFVLSAKASTGYKNPILNAIQTLSQALLLSDRTGAQVLSQS